MYNKKEWVSKEVITKEALNNIENGIADLDAKMNDVATKKELQAIENNIAENNNELNDLKEGLVASLVAQGHKVDGNSSWKDLFDILLAGSGSVPNVPNPDDPEDLGEGILLYKAGTQNNNTEFRNLCLTNAANSLTSNAICYDLNVSRPHVWFSYDGFVNFDDYDRVEITAYTESSTQQPAIGLGITSKSGQCGYEGSSNWDGTPHTDLTLMYNVTETKYSLPINYTGSGYLLIWMNHANSALGRVYITEIRVIPKKTGKPCTMIKFSKTNGFKITGSETLNLNDYLVIQPDDCTDPVMWYTNSNAVAVTDGIVTVLAGGVAMVQAKCGGYSATVSVEAVVEQEPYEPTGGMVLFDGGYNTTNSDFGRLSLPTNYVYEDSGRITIDLKNEVCTWGAFCSPNQVNFNNYDAVAITIYTENKQQTNTQLLVARGTQTTFMIGTGNNEVTTVMYEEVAFKALENTTTPQTYVFNFADLRKEDNDMGYLGFRVKKGDGDGKVYISKIVVYPEGTYYTESIDE